MMLELQRYRLRIYYKKGKSLKIADTLSRNYRKENIENSEADFDNVFEVNSLEIFELQNVNIVQDLNISS